MSNLEKIKKQSAFCFELAKRLNDDIQKAEKPKYYEAVDNHSRMENDAIRLRRELNVLRKMLYPWSDENDKR